MRRLVLLAVLTGPGFLSSQAPLGSPATIRLDVAGADPAPESPAATRIAVGEKSLGSGKAADTLRDFLAAAELHPASPAILRFVLRACADDPDSRAVFGVALALATLDEKGRATGDRGDKDLLLPKDPWPARIAQAQFAALEDVVRELGRVDHQGRNAPGGGIVARWLADLAIELGRDAPRVLAARAAAIDAAVARHVADHATVFAGLRKLFGARITATSAGPSGDDAAATAALDRAMRAARVVLGLAAQVGFGKDLQGPQPPDLGTLPRDAREALGGLEKEVASRAGEPWTVERLQALTPAEREEFTRVHQSRANPGVAISPHGRYRIETVCGFETLLGAASTIEYHHARLVSFFGSDPFEQRPGLVRIEPEHTGLESDGAPFWWAGGFQGGDVTTVRFAWSSIPGLGKGLTHELTHRFDGALFPFLPPWATEGRAVWTAASYGAITDPTFAPEALNPWTIQTPFVKGYGGVEKLKKLLDGTIDDYRDNYTAGYALFVYLKQWSGDGDKPLFAERLEKFMRNARAGKADPVGYFTTMFADGKDGRPEDLEAFAKGFGEFMHQCYRACWNERDAANAWLDRHAVNFTGDKGYGRVHDAPSLSWARDRAEPWFGQGQADAAARLFDEVDDPRSGAAAGCWALLVDGFDPERVKRLAADLDASGHRDAAWVLREEGAQRFPALAAPSGTPPLAGRLSKVKAFCDLLREAAADQRANGRPLAAAAFAERQRRIASRLGFDAAAVELPAQSASMLPRNETPHVLGAFGWVEDGLTGREERRVAGLWFETPQGDIHVGRSKPKDDTGLTDRAAHQRDAFVRSAEWFAPGRYVVRARIHFTTSFVSGEMVVGYTRRDRNLRIRFSAGDFLYSIGRKEDDGKTNQVNLSIDGTWEREGPLSNGDSSRPLKFEQPSSFVDLEVRVDGPTVDVLVMGEPFFRYTTVDLSPIEGAIGFAMGQGAVRVQAPTVQCLDRGALLPPAEGEFGFEELIKRPLSGVPTGPNGTIVIWLPTAGDQDDVVTLGGRWLRTLSKAMRDHLTYPQSFVLMVGATCPEATLAKLQDIAREVTGAELTVARDTRKQPPEDDAWILFVDAAGVLRAASSGGETAMPKSVENWARWYRAAARD